MKKTIEATTTDTWFVLEDGTTADPGDVTYDDEGVLRAKDGTAVAMRGSLPHTTGNKDRPNPNKKTGKGKELEAETEQPGYKTRETKGK